MPELASSFEDAWARFHACDALRLAGDTPAAEWAHGRAQWLTFQVRIEDAAARHHLRAVAERLDVPGVEPFPDWYWHITVKPAGFQVIKRTREDDVLRQEVPRLAGRARALLTKETAFDVRLGLANAFPDVAFVEVLDDGRLAALNERLADELDAPRYETDGGGFLPHVSVARFCSNDGLDQLKDALAALRDAGPGPSFPVRRVEFVKAWLSENPPEFDTIATYALAGRPR